MNNEIEDFKDILNDDYINKYPLIKEDLYLNIFAYDEDSDVRCWVAREGYEHNILMYDKDWGVRCNVAEFSKDKFILEHLSNDEDKSVRYRAEKILKELYDE